MDRKLYRWYYDNIACRYYDAFMKWCFLPFGGEAKTRRILLDAACIERGGRILDMCCGTGGATFGIAERAGADSQIVGVDLSHGQIRVARKRNRFSNVRFMVSDATNTPFGDGRFDTVVIPHAIHEMPHSARLAVLGEARRVLRAGGALAVLEMDNPPNLLLRLSIGLWWFYWLPFNFETPTRMDMFRRGLANEVGEAGFRDVTATSLFSGVFQVVRGTK